MSNKMPSCSTILIVSISVSVRRRRRVYIVKIYEFIYLLLAKDGECQILARFFKRQSCVKRVFVHAAAFGRILKIL